MSAQPYLFQLEDGGSLSLAVHSEIPQYDRICEIIHANRGFVVEESSSADFCILSPVLPDVEGIAEELRVEGKLAIQDYWIRDSMDTGQLLPWYSYQIGPSPSIARTIGKDASLTMAIETEERDIHELVATSARYWPLLSEEELCRYVSRKCPHRSATSFRDLYTLHQSDIDSRVAYLRGRLENAFTFDNSFSKRPRMSFGSPNKVIHPQLKVPSSSSVPVIPTPTATARGDDTEMMGPENVAGTSRTMNQEMPVETPRMDENTRNSPANAAPAHTGVAAEGSGKKGGSDNSDDMVALQLIPAPTQSTVPAPKWVPPVRKNGTITHDEFQALALFLVENPWTGGKLGYTTHFEKFCRTNPLGKNRTARAWREAYDRHPVKVNGLMMNLKPRKPAGAQASHSITRAKAQSGSKPMSQGVKTSEEDKQALAKWIFDHPRGPSSTNQPYFERFMAHHKTLPYRSWNTWLNAANNHKDDIAARQRKFATSWKKNYKRSMSSVSTVMVPASPIDVVLL